MDYNKLLLKHKIYLWSKFDNNKYIRQNIYYQINLKKENYLDIYSNNKYMLNIIHDNNNNNNNNNKISNTYIFKHLLINENENDNNDSNDYINGEFKDNFELLRKSIYSIQKETINVIPILLSEIFNVCNIVAIDLQQKIIISIRNCILYIILYDKFIYISLNLKHNIYEEKNQNKFHGVSNDNYHDIQHHIKRFIKYSLKNKIFHHVLELHNKREKKNDYDLNRILRLFTKYISIFPVKQQLQSQQQQQYNNNNDDYFKKALQSHSIKSDIFTTWPKSYDINDFLSWIYTYNDDCDMYSRRCIHFDYELNDIYNLQNNDNNNNNNNNRLLLEKIGEKLLYLNHLYVNHKSLIHHNVIHIDFKNYYFIVLNITKKSDNENRKLCEFKTVSFDPNFGHYRGKNSNNLMIPISSYSLYIDLKYLHFNHYIYPLLGNCHS